MEIYTNFEHILINCCVYKIYYLFISWAQYTVCDRQQPALHLVIDTDFFNVLLVSLKLLKKKRLSINKSSSYTKVKIQINEYFSAILNNWRICFTQTLRAQRLEMNSLVGILQSKPLKCFRKAEFSYFPVKKRPILSKDCNFF